MVHPGNELMPPRSAGATLVLLVLAGCTSREPTAGSLSKPGAMPAAPSPDAGSPPPAAPAPRSFVPPVAGPPVHPADALCSAEGSDYEVIDTGTLGVGFSWLSSVNRSGKAVGASLVKPGVAHAILYDVATRTMVDLAATDPGYSTANAINDAGMIAGAIGLGAENYFPFAISPSGTWLDLGLLDSELQRSRGAAAVNSLGHVAGYTVKGGETHAFLWRDGAVLDLGTLGGSSFAFAVNDADQVAGMSAIASGVMHPFLYAQGAMRDLGTLGGNSGMAFALNASGIVVGASETQDGSVRAFRYDGRLTELRVAGPFENALATSIDSRGQIVGWTTDDTRIYLDPLPVAARSRAFLIRDDGTQVDLSETHLLRAGFENARVFSLSESGIIAGSGSCGNGVHGFLLVPRRN
jgi:probable HAF family extracellular repeat protein